MVTALGEKGLGRDRVCHAQVEKQTADSSVYFRDNNSKLSIEII